jgi:signal transduction histidine kinase
LTRGFAGLDPLSVGPMRLPDLERRLGWYSQAAAIVHGQQAWGFLLLAQPDDTPAEWLAPAETLLLGTARTLALHLQLEEEARQRHELLEQIAESADLVLRGEAGAGLIHELNNCLNGILLQASIVETRLTPQLREEMDVIQRQGRQAAALLRPLQQGRQEQRQRVRPVDLNRIVREVRTAETEASRHVRTDLAPDLPPVAATCDGLRNLVRWLLHVVLSRQPSSAGPVSVRTRVEGPRVLLVLEDAGPPVPETALVHLFDTEEGIFAPSSLLEGLASRSLLRQFGATLQAQARREGGLTWTVEWKAAPGS